MTVIEQIEHTEAKLAEAGKTVAALCRHLDIARSTWDRWKAGKHSPNMAVWSRVTQGIHEFFLSLPLDGDQDAA